MSSIKKQKKVKPLLIIIIILCDYFRNDIYVNIYYLINKKKGIVAQYNPYEQQLLPLPIKSICKYQSNYHEKHLDKPL